MVCLCMSTSDGDDDILSISIKANMTMAHVMAIRHIIIYLCMDNTTLLSSHRGCSKDKIRPTLVLRPSTILSLLSFRQI